MADLEQLKSKYAGVISTLQEFSSLGATVDQVDLDGVCADNHHQPEIEHRALTVPEQDERKRVPYDEATGQIEPEGRKMDRIDRDEGQAGVAHRDKNRHGAHDD